jgi:hypothetical protein
MLNGCIFESRDQRSSLEQEKPLRHEAPNDVVHTSSLIGFTGALATGMTMWTVILLIALG